MKTTIYFSNSSIQVVTGTVKKNSIEIQAYDSFALPENALINGVITDENALQEQLKTIQKKLPFSSKNTCLVLDSTLILLKQFVLPHVGANQMRQLVCNEMADFQETHEPLIYDYCTIRNLETQKEGVSVLACAVEKSMVGDFIRLFENSGIPLKQIDVALSALVRFVEYLPELREETFILTNIEGNNIVSVLFVKGAYMFSNRSRLLADYGSDEYMAELSSWISSLLQFHRSQKSEHELHKVYFAGLGQAELANAKRMLRLLTVEIDKLPNFGVMLPDSFKAEQTFAVAGYIYNTGALIGE